MKDKTSIIISHRDSALRYADKVVETLIIIATPST
jgi:ABC-type bacteriocin/lantibiotic exporter with double-glycine peptidase domain